MDTLAEIRSMLMSRVSGKANRAKILDMAKQYLRDSDGVKDDYLMALFFPEYAPNVRIPSPFGLPSTLHTQKQESYLTTGATGDGILIFTLADLHWNLCYAATSVPSGSTGMGGYTLDGFKQPFYCPDIYAQRYLPNNFSHARVVGASVRISYIGQHDEEQGFMVGAHIQNQNIMGITDRDIEDGYHVKRVRPMEGLRLSYTPFDDKDFQFTELNTRVVYDNGASAYYTTQASSTTPFTGCKSYEIRPADMMYAYDSTYGVGESAQINRLQVQQRVLSIPPTSTTNVAVNNATHEYEQDNMQPTIAGSPDPVVGWVNLSSDMNGNLGPVYNPVNFCGMGPRAGHTTNQFPQIVAMYYRGLPKNEKCLRIDIVRHLECIPRSENKQFMCTERPQFCDNTQKLAAQIQHKQSNLQVTSLAQTPQLIAATNTLLLNTETPEEVLDNLFMIDNPINYQMIQQKDPGFWESTYNSARQFAGPAAAGLLAYGVANQMAPGSGKAAALQAFLAAGGSQAIANSLGLTGQDYYSAQNDAIAAQYGFTNKPPGGLLALM